MSGSDDSQDKQFEPTQKKLDDARKKGDVPRSVDLTTSSAYAGFLLICITFGGQLFLGIASDLARLLEFAPELAADWFSGGLQAGFGARVGGVIWLLSPWFAVPAACAVLAVVAQQAFVVAPSKLEPRIDRISPVSNAKNKFGRQGLFEFAKSFTKLLIFSATLGLFLVSRTDQLTFSVQLQPRQIVLAMGAMSISFFSLVLLVSAGLGFIDFFWQRAEHIRKNRMSRKELMDEAKQMEGDPYIKQHRRQRAQEIANNRMLADVPGADVVIVNPTHFAVALKWNRASGAAPICVAKGVDAIAARIREIAEASAVPVRHDPPAARAIHASVEVGAEIQPEHYHAVASAIRFAEAMQARARRAGWRK